MKTWYIWYNFWRNNQLMEKSVLIEANSYDEALAEARKTDPRYDSGKVVINV